MTMWIAALVLGVFGFFTLVARWLLIGLESVWVPIAIKGMEDRGRWERAQRFRGVELEQELLPLRLGMGIAGAALLLVAVGCLIVGAVIDLFVTN